MSHSSHYHTLSYIGVLFCGVKRDVVCSTHILRIFRHIISWIFFLKKKFTLDHEWRTRSATKAPGLLLYGIFVFYSPPHTYTYTYNDRQLGGVWSNGRFRSHLSWLGIPSRKLVLSSTVVRLWLPYCDLIHASCDQKLMGTSVMSNGQFRSHSSWFGIPSKQVCSLGPRRRMNSRDMVLYQTKSRKVSRWECDRVAIRSRWSWLGIP